MPIHVKNTRAWLQEKIIAAKPACFALCSAADDLNVTNDYEFELAGSLPRAQGTTIMWEQYRLHQRNHWIFDLDGTLTISAHDFEYIRHKLGLGANVPILEALNAMPEDQAAPLWESLNEMEEYFAEKSSLMHGAIELLQKLQARGAKLAILTRNTMPVVEKTLRACGIDHFFPVEQILDRDSCTPKPSPDGIRHLLEYWQADADDTVMVGDYLFDLQAGRGAGVTTIHLDQKGEFVWPEVADICIREFAEIEGLVS
jgi:HAD superfamily hydrolase (TIGR01549 family)